MALVWLIAAIILTVAELFTTTFVLIMFAGGALVAAGVAGLGAPLALQGIIFAAVSAAGLLVVRPVVRRHRLGAAAHLEAEQHIGLEAVDGGTGLVLERGDTEHGQVKIGGEIWTARAYDASQVMEPGERVRVIEVKGATAMVWRMNGTG